jgi:hypothetical protein
MAMSRIHSSPARRTAMLATHPGLIPVASRCKLIPFNVGKPAALPSMQLTRHHVEVTTSLTQKPAQKDFVTIATNPAISCKNVPTSPPATTTAISRSQKQLTAVHDDSRTWETDDPVLERRPIDPSQGRQNKEKTKRKKGRIVADVGPCKGLNLGCEVGVESRYLADFAINKGINSGSSRSGYGSLSLGSYSRSPMKAILWRRSGSTAGRNRTETGYSR